MRIIFLRGDIMITVIIIAALAAACFFAVRSYMKKISYGCCGAGGGEIDEKLKKPDISECKYKYTVKIGGMSCKKCAERIENAFLRQGIAAEVNHVKGEAVLYSKEPTSEFTIRSTVIGLNYTVERIEENEL